MTLKTQFLAAAAAFAMPAAAYAQQPAPVPPASGPAVTPPAATPPAPSSTTTPPTQAPADATETAAQQPVNTADDPLEQNAQATPPAAPTPTAPPPATPAPGTQAQATPPAVPPVAAGPVQQATAADIRAGVPVHDQQGGAVGTIESADAGTAVVNTGTARARLALASFGRNNAGLVISMTKAQLEAAVAAARPGA